MRFYYLLTDVNQRFLVPDVEAQIVYARTLLNRTIYLYTYPDFDGLV